MSSTSLPRRAQVQENEISGLIEWSLPWAKGVSAVSLLVSLQSVGFALAVAATSLREPFFWHLMLGASSLTLASSLLRYVRKGAKYVASADERLLSAVMSELNVVLSVLLCTLLGVVVSVCSNLADALVLRHALQWTPATFAFMGIAVLGAPLVAFGFMKAELRTPYANEGFLKHINPFATRLLPGLRFLSVFAIASGLMTVGFGIADYLYEISESATRVIGSGVVLAAFGGAIQWYRRAVRDIQRNPTPYFLERTLNRLNLFWLLCIVFFGVLFVVGFF